MIAQIQPAAPARALMTLGVANATTELEVRCDSVLYAGRSERELPRHGADNLVPIYAMSMIGPEQAIRAIAAACAMGGNDHYDQMTRPALTIKGPGPNGRIIHGRWTGSFRHRSRILTKGAVHTVAMPELRSQDLIAEDLSERGDRLAASQTQVIIATSQQAMRDELYRRLHLCFTTPLVPCGLPGQPQSERQIGEQWRERITYAIMQGKHWKPLRLHPDQTEQSWAHAGVLTISQDALDTLISGMVRKGVLAI